MQTANVARSYEQHLVRPKLYERVWEANAVADENFKSRTLFTELTALQHSNAQISI